MRIVLASFLTLLMAAPQASHATSSSEVGVAAAVNTVTTGIPPVQPEQILTIGAEIVHNERIITDASGQTQLLFRDGSTFTVGENANVVIDDFVFDPETSKGKLALSVTRGAFRFVGGKLSKDGSVAISTPAAVLGVRGGIVTGEVSEDGGTMASLHFGDALTVAGRNGQLQTVTRPGFGVTVSRIGAAPQPPRRMTAGEVNATVAHLTGKAATSGGTTTTPTGAAINAALGSPSQIGAGLQIPPSQLAPPTATATATAAAKPVPAPTPTKTIGSVINTIHQLTVTASQEAQAQKIAGAKIR
jgi:hypothetical protein